MPFLRPLAERAALRSARVGSFPFHSPQPHSHSLFGAEVNADDKQDDRGGYDLVPRNAFGRFLPRFLHGLLCRFDGGAWRLGRRRLRYVHRRRRFPPHVDVLLSRSRSLRVRNVIDIVVLGAPSAHAELALAFRLTPLEFLLLIGLCRHGVTICLCGEKLQAGDRMM
jgi:hypothetical protein